MLNLNRNELNEVKNELETPRNKTSRIQKDYKIIEIYYNLTHYRPFKNYNGREIRKILKNMKSNAPLPNKRREKIIIENRNIEVFLVNDGKFYYFKENFKQFDKNKIRIRKKEYIN